MLHEGEIGAVILEPIRATDVHVPSGSYFKRLRELCDTHEAVLIFDEIPTGFGRVGYFYAHQYFGIEPDIIVLGKGIGGGIVPQAAVLIKSKFNIAQDISLGHYTHEKSAVGCRAILSTINYIQKYNLLQNVAHLGDFIDKYLATIKQQFHFIGDVRRAGFLIAIEIVKDKKSKERDHSLADSILYQALQTGLSFKIGHGNVLVLQPPLIATKTHLDESFLILSNIFDRIEISH
jgi:4-aminobutyrate aminotransferase